MSEAMSTRQSPAAVRRKSPGKKKAAAPYQLQLSVVGIRNRLGLTQQDFASLLGLSTVSVSRWEHEHTKQAEWSCALLGLVDRALNRQEPPAIIRALRRLDDKDERGRIIALVHLGD